MPLEEKPVVDFTVILPEPVILVSDATAIFTSVEAELYILSPLAATTLFAKVTTIKGFSAVVFVIGTT